MPTVSDRRTDVPPRTEEEILGRLRTSGPSVVALSGGVDSAVVATLAVRALHEQAHAVTFTGAAVSREEVERAVEVARSIGIDHALVPVNPLGEEGYRTNPSNRCYFCRRVESGALRAWGSERGIRTFLDGVQLDDLGDDRPGIRAMDEAGFFHPLLWAAWRKADVRAFAHSAGLPNWDAPSDACLASRIRHGEEVTIPLLTQVDASERLVRSHGFRRVRVRIAAARATVEVDPEEVDRLRAEPLASTVRAGLLALGFGDVVLDEHGYHGRPRA
ncbi:MAG: ATP-dependent sacrificial sulfur transferase LarE [Thermoplasmata archaeon]|nr:ATP-dependent sacrificial sulfur transferase LarE [Thermoplasmata archaeon]